jgi:hypothetical protein
MPDRFESTATGLTAPASHGFAIAPSDSADLTEVTRALFIGAAGSVSVVMASGAALTFSNLAGGTVLPIRARQVKATGTTATSIVGLV